jgi:hypothetical protein
LAGRADLLDAFVPPSTDPILVEWDVPMDCKNTDASTGLPKCSSTVAALRDVRDRRGVRPCGWTESSCRFDRPPGVLILELRWAEVA